MSVSIATATGLLSRIACSCLKLDRKGFQTRAGSVIPWTAPWWWWKARPLQPLSREPSPCSSSAFFSILLGSAYSVGHCSRLPSMRSRFSLVPPQGSIYFRLEQVHSAPSPSVLSLLVSHLRRGNTLSRLRALPMSALSLGCYLRFPRHVPAMMRLSRLPISVFPLNGGARRLPSSAPSPSVVPPGRACR